MIKNIEVQWSEIRCAWNYANCDRRFLREGAILPPFQDVLVSSPTDGRCIGQGILDWWPREELVDRTKVLEEHGWFGVRWTTNKAAFHTAELFNEAKDDPEQTVRVWVGATVKDLLDDLPDSWRGDPVDLLHGIERALRSEFDWWHFASRGALPARIPGVVEAMRPTKVEHVIEVAVSRAHEVRSNWILARVSHVERALRVVGG